MLSPDTPYPIGKTSKKVIFLKNFITNPNIQVGDYTYFHGGDSPESFEKRNVAFAFSSQLIIGKFCQIAFGTKFILSDANHPMNGFSTFPFFIFGKLGDDCSQWADCAFDLPNKGDTVIGNDVWFGHESLVLPGVKIGDGAIIGARAVVTKDVAPYTIVGGNPAEIIRKRFPAPVIEQLLNIRWWDWDYDAITRHISAIAGADIQALQDCERFCF
ncbi:MAG: CatB-related O-acetyltransferase [Chlamydiia bacterium]|nr:CatB-related O-acetyltransferase [Chlamydiia bacterium]